MARAFYVCLCALSVLLWFGQGASADEKSGASETDDTALVSKETDEQDGATARQVAAGMMTLLQPVERKDLVLPTTVAERITEQTAGQEERDVHT